MLYSNKNKLFHRNFSKTLRRFKTFLFLKISRLRIFQNSFWLFQIYHENRFIYGCRPNILKIIYSRRLGMGKISSYWKLFSSKNFTVDQYVLHLCAFPWNRLELVENIAFQKHFSLLYIPVLLSCYFGGNFSTNGLKIILIKNRANFQSWNICISNISYTVIGCNSEGLLVHLNFIT